MVHGPRAKALRLQPFGEGALGRRIDGGAHRYDGAGPRAFHNAVSAENDLLHLMLVGGEDDDEVAFGGGLCGGRGDLHMVGAGDFERGGIHIHPMDREARFNEMTGYGAAHFPQANQANAGDCSVHGRPP
jgi:hypothetical protein